jgi:hypothetical protein
VKATLKLDDALASGHGAREPQRVIGRLRTARAERHLLGARDAAHERFGRLDFQVERSRADEIDTIGDLGDAAAYGGMTVAEQIGAESAMKIDVLVALGIVEMRA